MVQRLGHYDGMSNNDWKHLRCGYGEGWERIKWTDKIKNAVVLERVREGRKMLDVTNKEEEKKIGWPLTKKELPVEGCSRRNGKRDEGSRQKNISDGR